jgi:hypothetical protein
VRSIEIRGEKKPCFEWRATYHIPTSIPEWLGETQERHTERQLSVVGGRWRCVVDEQTVQYAGSRHLQ